MLEKLRSFLERPGVRHLREGKYIDKTYWCGHKKSVWLNDEKITLEGDGKLESFVIGRMKAAPQLASAPLATDILDPRLNRVMEDREQIKQWKTGGKLTIERPEPYENCSAREKHDAEDGPEHIRCTEKKVVHESRIPDNADFLPGWRVRYEEKQVHEKNYDLWGIDDTPEDYRLNTLTFSHPGNTESPYVANQIIVTDKIPLDTWYLGQEEEYSTHEVKISFSDDKVWQETSVGYDPETGKMSDFPDEMLFCDRYWEKKPKKA